LALLPARVRGCDLQWLATAARASAACGLRIGDSGRSKTQPRPRFQTQSKAENKPRTFDQNNVKRITTPNKNDIIGNTSKIREYIPAAFILIDHQARESREH
jgi:hypothetical protein